MNAKLFFFGLLLSFVVISCNKDDDNNDDVCETTDITYNNTVASVFNGSCAVAGCHVTGNEANAFFSLEGYQNAKAVADFGRLIGAISHETDFSPMPAGADKLDQCTIDKITAWVNAGAPE